MLPVETTYERTVKRCKELGFGLAGVQDIFEALDYGLLDPVKNPSFGCNTGEVDWIWSNQTQMSPKLAVHIVSRHSERTIMSANDNFWGFCARQLGK